jgi:hypothetical protein
MDSSATSNKHQNVGIDLQQQELCIIALERHMFTCLHMEPSVAVKMLPNA